MATLSSIRNSINTTDEFYEKENEFFDVEVPTLMPLFIKLIYLFITLNTVNIWRKNGNTIFRSNSTKFKNI